MLNEKKYNFDSIAAHVITSAARRKKRLRRALAGATIAAVVIGGAAAILKMSAGPAFAVTRSVASENELAAALAQAGDGDTIEFTAVIPVTRSVMTTPSRNLTFASAAHNNCPGNVCGLVRASGFTGDLVTLQSFTNLTIRDLSLDGEAAYLGAVAGSLVRSQYFGNVLHLSDGAILENNHTTGSGGGVAGASTLQISSGATLTGLTADKNGGAIAVAKSANGAGATVQMSGGTISNCAAGEDGGAMRVEGVIALSGNALITENSAHDGGGIYLVGTLNATAGTISRNTATLDGGGLWVPAASRENINIKSPTRFLGNTAGTYNALPPRAEDIPVYNAHITTPYWSDSPATGAAFAWGLNNYDISYEAAGPLPEPTPMPVVPISPYPWPWPWPTPDPDPSGGGGNTPEPPNTGR